MSISPVAEFAALALTLVVHLVGAGVIIWDMLSGERDRPRLRDLWPRDDDGWGRPGPEEPLDPPSGGGTHAPFPFLDDSLPAPVRLREPGRLADAHPRPRRPAHPPVPARPRDPADS